MDESRQQSGSIFASLGRIAEGGLGFVQKRLELFALELREEKCRLVETVVWAVATVALGIMTLALLTFLVMVLFWENARVEALVGLSLAYLAATFLGWRSLRVRLTRSTAFSGSLSEIKKHRAWFQSDTPP